MITLIKLELKRNKMRTYVIASLIIAITMLGFLYLFAYAPMLEPTDKDMAIFLGYDNLICLFGALNMATFCVLSAVMYSKFIIEDYSGKRTILLFSYPVSRKKIMLSKISLVSIFTIVSMVVSNIIIFFIFATTEKFIHIVNSDFTIYIMIKAIETTLLMSIIAASVGIVAVGIGFIKKSVPTTIVSSVLIASMMCNIASNSASNEMVIYVFAIAMILVSVVFSIILMKKAYVMEVE